MVPGEGYVRKGRTSAFCEPCTNLCILDDDLRTEWMAGINTVEVWSEMFAAASATAKITDPIGAMGGDSRIVKETDFAAHFVQTQKTLAFQTPNPKRLKVEKE